MEEKGLTKMKHNLDHIYSTFKKAQSEPFPISDDELRSMMDNGFQEKQHNRPTISKGKIIMATTSSIVLMILSALFFFGVDTNEANKMFDSALGSESAPTMQVENSVQDNHIPTTSSFANNSDTPTNTYSVSRQNQYGEYIFTIDSNAREPHLIQPIILDKNNASCFGIEIKEDGLQIKYETGYLLLGMENRKMEYFNKKYPANGIAHVSRFIPFKSTSRQPNDELIDEYTGWNMENFQSVMPIDIYFLRAYSDGRKYSNYTECCQPRGIDDTLVLSYLFTGFGSHHNEVSFDMAAALAKCQRDGKALKFLVGKEFDDMNMNIIPVIYQKVSNADTLTMIIRFADITVGKQYACRQLLRESGFSAPTSNQVHYSAKFLEDYNQMRILYDQLVSEKTDAYKPEYTKFTGVNMLELSDKELEKLCIYRTDTGYSFEANQFGSVSDYLREGGYNTQSDSLFFRTYYSLTKTDIKNTGNLVKYRGWDLSKADTTLPSYVWLEHVKCRWDPYRRAYEVVPSFVFSSLDEFDIRASGNVSISSRMKDKFSNYLPVHLSLGNKNEIDSSKISYSDIILWIRCSVSLLEKLPERYRDRLVQELSIIGQIEKGEINADNACSLLPEQKSYFGLCGRVSGAVRNPEVNPTPVITNAECKFLLLEDRQVKFSLYQANGNLVKQLSGFRQFSAGHQSEKFDLGEMQAGVYFLTLESDKDEMVYTKIVVGK